MDLQGSKLRISTFKDGSVRLEDGQEFHLHLEDVDGDMSIVQLTHLEEH